MKTNVTASTPVYHKMAFDRKYTNFYCRQRGSEKSVYPTNNYNSNNNADINPPLHLASEGEALLGLQELLRNCVACTSDNKWTT
jgi:hypothetical protein